MRKNMLASLERKYVFNYGTLRQKVNIYTITPALDRLVASSIRHSQMRGCELGPVYKNHAKSAHKM